MNDREIRPPAQDAPALSATEITPEMASANQHESGITSGDVHNAWKVAKHIKSARQNVGGRSSKASRKRPNEGSARRGPEIRNPFVNLKSLIKIKAGKPANRDMKKNFAEADGSAVYILTSTVRRRD